MFFWGGGNTLNIGIIKPYYLHGYPLLVISINLC